MKRITTLAALLVFGAGTALASQTMPPWPMDTLDENDPQVIAWYQAKCENWASEMGVQADGRQTYVAGCMQNAPETWPVGYEEEKE